MRQMMRRFGMVRRLLFGLLLLGGITALGMMGLVYQGQKQAAETLFREQAGVLIEGVRDSVQLGLTLDDRAFVQDSLDPVQASLPLLIGLSVYDRAGRLFMYSGQIDVGQKTLPAALLARIKTQRRIVQTGRKLHDDWVRIDDPQRGTLLGVVHLRMNQDFATALWQGPLRRQLLLMLLAMLASAVLCLVWVRYTTRPVQDLNQGVTLMAAGELSVRLPVHRQDELGELAAAFNDMAAALQQRDAALMHSEKRYRQLFKNLPEAMFICDARGRLKEKNTAFQALLGKLLGSADMAGWLQLLPAAELRFVHKCLQRLGVLKDHQINIMDAAGNSHQLLLTVRRRGAAETAGFEGMIRDITAMQSLQDQLAEAQKMESLGRLAGGVAHDFNNLLASIMGSAYLLQELAEDQDAAIAASVAVIIQASERGRALTQNLLGFARKGKNTVEPVNLAELAEDVRALVQHMTDRQQSIQLSGEADLPLIAASSDQVHQVLMNLCINACDAVHEQGGSRVHIRVYGTKLTVPEARRIHGARAGRFVCVAVEDDGGGMSEAVRAHIFDPFFTTKGLNKGTGLGLATVYGIVHNHQGFISVDSEEGVGSVFRVYFPLGDPAAVLSAGPPALPVKSHVQGGCVLCVDDEPALLRMLSQLLPRWGIEVLLAHDGQQALALLEEHAHQIDLVLLDLIMPGMGGEDVLHALREVQPELPVVLMSGYAEEAAKRKITLEHYQAFLAKPYNPDQLRQCLQTWLPISQVAGVADHPQDAPRQ